MELLNDIYVISLTHWDREWRFPFQKTRMLLVEIMDELLEVLDNDPDYTCFHLDGQTILLEDYCEVRPENAEKIRKYVEEGRLVIGPWFVLPEENQMSGESLVRNFLWGERIGSKYGGCCKCGYTPTSWGQVSQMPQIFNGIGVDNIIFYRGISADQVKGHYYNWKGPDGSTLFGVRLGDHARVAFFHLIDRRIAMNRDPEYTQHEWKTGGKPFRLCGTGSSAPYHFAEPPIGWYPERIEEAFTDLDANELGQWETPFALGFDGDDSTGPFRLTPKIIAEANTRITNGKKVVQTDMLTAVREAQEYLKDRELETVTGEMRNPQRAGLFTDLYAEVQATRIPMKYMNRRAEFNLQRQAEPLATVAWTLGSAYPRFALDQANKFVLMNHAHDSIGGCGRDEINDEVEFRFRQADIFSGFITEDAARAIAGKIDTSSFDPEEILLIVFNTLPRSRSEVVKAELDIAENLGVKGFRVLDLDGQEVDAQVINTSGFQAVFNHPQELPLRINSDRWEIYFNADDIPGTGYVVFRIVPEEGELRHTGSMMTGPDTMENEFMSVTVNPNGTVDVVSKETGKTLREQNLFQDRGEVGDYWVGGIPVQDRVFTSRGSRATVSVVENGKLSCALEARLSIKLPVRASDDCTHRVKETRPVNITTVYRLVKGERFLRIATTVENTVEDHVLRTLFPTGVTADIACAETAFDVVERAIPLPDTRDWREPYRPGQPHQNFVDVSDGEQGVALLNRGLPQYEAVDDVDRSLALILIRAHRAWNSVRLARYPDQGGTQLQGTYTFEYALMPHAGDWQSGGVLQAAEAFNVPMQAGTAGPGGGTLPLKHSFVTLDGDGLVMNTLKQGEWDESMIVRISNPGSRDVTGMLKTALDITKAELVDMLEQEVQETLECADGCVTLHVPAKKILTVKLTI
jgi:hypothetical protein